MHDDDLFDWAGKHYPETPGFTKGSATSEGAAFFIMPRAGTLRRRILDFITEQGSWGATYDECVFSLNIKPQTVSPRISELRLGGLIMANDRHPFTRMTRQGVQAVVYVLKPKNP